MAEPKIGEKAPDFTLKSTSGDRVSLGQFNGQKNVLVAFFPLAFTGVCTKENCAFSEDYSKFETRDTAVLPVSEDKFFTKRAYFLVGKDGTLRWKHVEAELGHSRDNSELLSQIEALGRS